MELDISFPDWRQRIPYSWHGKRKRWTQDILETTGFFGNVQAPPKFSKVRRSAWYVIQAGRLLSRFSNEVKDRVLLQSTGLSYLKSACVEISHWLSENYKGRTGIHNPPQMSQDRSMFV